MSIQQTAARAAESRPDPNVPQSRAAHPDLSVSVGASAGTGKTKVLTDRVLRLLLPRGDGRPGTAPHRILCLTFTKAAASEMLQRIGRILGEWAVMDEAELTKKLTALNGHPPDEETVRAARRLFAAVVDTPGGLKIMTIHSFCQSVLGRFPLEAGLPPHFTVIDEAPAAELMARARDSVLLQARQNPQAPLGRALLALAAAQNEDQFSHLLRSLGSERRQLAEAVRDMATLPDRLAVMLGLAPGETAQTITAAACQDTAFDRDALYACCRALASGSATDQERGLAIQLWLDRPAVRAETLEAYAAQFLTADSTLRKRLATTGVQKEYPECIPALEAEGTRLAAVQDRIRAARCAACTYDLLLLGSAMISVYQQLKDERAQLDYDDLIIRTLDLLQQPAIAPWILFKLDGGLDHILVDEAQDTNPEQWEIIKTLCDDFFSGQGARDETPRTIFTVGDEKQSIYSFQRAAPADFERMRQYFIEKAGASEEQMDVSFRSTPSVLRLVDEVFAPPHLRQGLGRQPLAHYSFRENQAGSAELWPLFATEDNPEEEPWTPPVQIVETPSGQARLAEHIGSTIRAWLDNEDVLESKSRPVRPGDIMILLRTRTAFVGQLVRALKTRNIPVSGIDRMVLGQEIAIMDLLALARFALLPADDLSLACLLKSPLVGYDEDRLYAIAAGRSDSLWQAVRTTNDEALLSWLDDLIRHAAADHPYEFFCRILQRPCPADKISGKRAIISRLGEDTLDPLGEFLNACLSYERDNIPTLQGFLIWQQQGDITIKREMEEAGNAVRIMTVHGSKGLQAPIVIMPDTTRSSSAPRETLLWPDKTGLTLPLWAARSADYPARYREARARLETLQDEEYRRLLYVALTRAEDRLYIGGCAGKRKPVDECWYNYIAAAFDRMDGVSEDGEIRRIANPQAGQPDGRAEAAPNGPESAGTLPGWLTARAPAEQFPPRPLMPSRPAEPDPAVRSPLDGDAEYRFRRGNITHKLLQILPDLPPDRREAAARHYVARPVHGLSTEIAESIVAETMAILENPAFAKLFGPGSQAEVPLTGMVSNRLISAQIDRLLITDDGIHIIDYKSNRPPPREEKDIPAAYRNQMQSYRDIVSRIYPGRRVRCYLLWTDGPLLMEIPALQG